MSGLPVTIRLLDPPIHEFIEVASFERELAELERGGDADAIERARTRTGRSPATSKRRIRCWELAAPGWACCCPALYEMQVRAVVEAALEVSAEGRAPGRDHAAADRIRERARRLRELVDLAVAEPREPEGRIEVEVGTMIELPRACLVAGRDRRARRILQLRHQRPHPDGPRFLSRRRRAWLPARVPLAGAGRAEPVRDDRRRGGRGAGRDGRPARSRDEAWAEAWNLRRARGGPGEHRVLPRRRPRLRELLPVPGADRAGRRGARRTGRLRHSGARAGTRTAARGVPRGALQPSTVRAGLREPGSGRAVRRSGAVSVVLRSPRRHSSATRGRESGAMAQRRASSVV